MLKRNITLDDLKKNRSTILMTFIVLAALLTVHLVWLAPLMGQIEEQEAQIDQQRELGQKYEEKLKQAQSIKENLTIQESELQKMQKRLFQGNDPYQLAASLGERLSAKEGQKLDIKTYQVLASKEYGLYQEVHLRFNFMTTIDGLYFFFERLRNFQTAILVQEINIQKIQRKTGPDLVINVILAALMEKGEKS